MNDPTESIIATALTNTQRTFNQMLTEVGVIRDALGKQTGDPWMTVTPPVPLYADQYSMRFLLQSSHRVIGIRRAHGINEKRWVLVGYIPRYEGDTEVQNWDMVRDLKTSVRASTPPDKIARVIEGKILAPLGDKLTKTMERNKGYAEHRTRLLQNANEIAKVLKLQPVEDRPQLRHRNEIDLLPCKCHPESITIKASVRSECVSMSAGTFGPVEHTVSLGGLTLKQAKLVLSVGQRMVREREYNIKRRKTKPTP
jgi:hypothetical protein